MSSLYLNNKLFSLLAVCFTFFLGIEAFAQTPTKQWDVRFGGSSPDYFYSLQQSTDGGYILGGSSFSGISGDKSQASWGGGASDYWVVKINNSGVKQWDARFGGTSSDDLLSLQQTTDGGYILGGRSVSGLSGDKSQASRGNDDYWVVKIDSSGVKEWDARFGGTSNDFFQSLQQTTDGGYILGGYVNSNLSGDISQASQGAFDYWVVKIDSLGVKEWDSRFGGSSSDYLNNIQQTTDGGYILGGRSNSGISGDVSQASNGGYDYWIVKIDSLGTKEWDARYGGSDGEYFASLQQTTDGGYILGGGTDSGISGDVSQATQGGGDFWIVKINSSGIIQWDARYGGSSDESVYSLQQTTDGGYILGGYSNSGISGDKTQTSQGSADYWIVKINSSGVIQWDSRYGGSSDEYLRSLQQTTDGGYVLGGWSNSGLSGDKSQASQGGYDYWVVKIGFDTWTGLQNTNWNNANNWSAGVPSSGADVIIPTGLINYPSLEVDVTVNDIEIESGATLGILPDQSLTVDGVLTNDGTLTVESGGSLVQGASGTLAGTGTYNIQRDIVEGQRFIGSPVNNHSVSGFGVSPSGSNGAQIIPDSSNVCNANTVDDDSPYGNIMEMREDAIPLSNCAQSLWHVKSSGNLTNARGYAVNTSTTTLEFSGTVNNGTMTYSGLGRQSGTINQWDGSQTRGWHLVSNPYPSPIRITDGDLGGDFDNAVYLYDGSTFTEIQLNLSDAVIAVAQGFQIRKSVVGGSATYSVGNAMREAGNPTFYKQSNTPDDYLNITLDNQNHQSTAMIYFEENATSAFDPRYDAVRLSGLLSIPLLYTIEENGERLSYNALPLLDDEREQSVPLSLYDAAPGSFTLDFEGINSLENTTVILEDKKLNTMTTLAEAYTYSFITEAGDTRDRFVLHFQKTEEVLSINSIEDQTIRLYPNPTNGTTNLLITGENLYTEVQILDISGKEVFYKRLEKGSNHKLNTEQLKSGVYFTRIKGNEDQRTLKLIKQ